MDTIKERKLRSIDFKKDGVFIVAKVWGDSFCRLYFGKSLSSTVQIEFVIDDEGKFFDLFNDISDEDLIFELITVLSSVTFSISAGIPPLVGDGIGNETEFEVVARDFYMRSERIAKIQYRLKLNH